jgi:hypothetical protein
LYGRTRYNYFSFHQFFNFTNGGIKAAETDAIVDGELVPLFSPVFVINSTEGMIIPLIIYSRYKLSKVLKARTKKNERNDWIILVVSKKKPIEVVE